MSHTKYMTVAWFAWGGGGSGSYLGEKKPRGANFGVSWEGVVGERLWRGAQGFGETDSRAVSREG